MRGSTLENGYIIGLGMIRFTNYPDRTVRDMAHEVVHLSHEEASMCIHILEKA
jgi:hypothetical protein